MTYETILALNRTTIDKIAMELVNLPAYAQKVDRMRAAVNLEKAKSGNTPAVVEAQKKLAEVDAHFNDAVDMVYAAVAEAVRRGWMTPQQADTVKASGLSGWGQLIPHIPSGVLLIIAAVMFAIGTPFLLVMGAIVAGIAAVNVVLTQLSQSGTAIATTAVATAGSGLALIIGIAAFVYFWPQIARGRRG